MADSARNTTVTLRTLKSGSATLPRSVGAVVIHDANEWSSLVGGDMPAVETNETLIGLFAGEKPTGGWAIEPNRAFREGDVLVIDAPLRGPAAGDMVTQALTYPYAVIAVNTRDFKSVRWEPSRAGSKDETK
ncbi:MAG TPA: protease complex subunit PrcB family protein [Thermoanaerobaculia bacterium]|nr:protease complex subunit PrcB family protein [Thermoanaerobaculia bacterium]